MLAIPVLAMGGMSTVSAAETSKTIEYNCLGSAAGLIDVDIDMDVTITGTVPESVEPGAEFEIENSYTNISMEVTDILRTAANPLQGNVSQFNLELENATDADGEDVVNVAETPLEFGPIDIADEDETVEFRVPSEGGIDVSLTAGDSGNVVITAGTILTTVEASALGISMDVDVTCNPLEGQDLVLNTINIGDDGEDPGDDDGKEPGDGDDDGTDPGDDDDGTKPGDGDGDGTEPGDDDDDGTKPGDDDDDGTKPGDDDDDGKGPGDDGDGNGDDNGDGNGTVDNGDDDNGLGGALPKTATTHPLLMLIGSLMAVAGGAVFFIRKRVLS